MALGEIKPESRAHYLRIMERLAQSSAEGIILGCTEISLLVHDEDSSVPLFDTTRIHAGAFVVEGVDVQDEWGAPEGYV